MARARGLDRGPVMVAIRDPGRCYATMPAPSPAAVPAVAPVALCHYAAGHSASPQSLQEPPMPRALNRDERAILTLVRRAGTSFPIPELADRLGIAPEAVQAACEYLVGR